MPIIQKVVRKLSDIVPARLAARLDQHDPSAWLGWGGPLNGQAARQQLVRDLFRFLPFETVLETGTYRAATTEFLAHVSGLPVYSVEALERYFLFAKSRCASLPKVEIELGDSRSWLERRAQSLADTFSFIYLDAHWQDDVPRHDELRIIHASWPRAVVMIDDFQVPDDPGYGYALYGGIPLTMAYLPPLPGWIAFYPATTSGEETGARRGCVVLAPANLADDLGGLPLLRQVDSQVVTTEVLS